MILMMIVVRGTLFVTFVEVQGTWEWFRFCQAQARIQFQVYHSAQVIQILIEVMCDVKWTELQRDFLGWWTMLGQLSQNNVTDGTRCSF